MKYYGLVDKIKDHHKKGYLVLHSDANDIKEIFLTSIAWSFIPVVGNIVAVSSFIKRLKWPKKGIKEVSKDETIVNKKPPYNNALVFSYEYVNKAYRFVNDSPEYFYGLFDNFIFKDAAFKAI